MTKVFEFLDKYAIRIAVTSVILLIIFLGGLYIQSIKNDIIYLNTNISNLFLTQQEVQDKNSSLIRKGLLIIIEQLEEVAKSQQYIIDQNRDKAQTTTTVVEKNTTKPSYTELKSHSVYIEGCTGKPSSDDTSCWSGTGVVIKITDTETYILTNNHVAGKDEKDVSLYIQNEQSRVVATVVDYNSYVDAAVLKVSTKLVNKTAIPGIASVNISDSVYVVGNPLGVKNIYSEGVVAGFEDLSMLIQVPCIYGSSGSGVFDKNGNLVGLVFALEMYPGFLGMPEVRITHSLVVDSVSIKSFLKDLGLYNEKE